MVKEFRLVSCQLAEALAAQDDALRIAELEDKQEALYTQLCIPAAGAALFCELSIFAWLISLKM